MELANVKINFQAYTIICLISGYNLSAHKISKKKKHQEMASKAPKVGSWHPVNMNCKKVAAHKKATTPESTLIELLEHDLITYTFKSPPSNSSEMKFKNWFFKKNKNITDVERN